MGRVSIIKCSNHEANLLTKEYLSNALLSLMDEKNFEDITITDIVKKANVSRVAFYNNYKNKFHLLKDIVLELSTYLLEEIGRPFEKNVDCHWYESFFERIKNISDIIQTLYKANLQSDYIQIVNEYILSKADNVNDTIAYNRLVWNGGIQNVIWFWLKRNMKESIKDIAAFSFNFLHKGKSYC
ncbi:MAG: TetR/AcrR family transcriptional regulator [Erysipelotrichaceae bacterium]|nr:TetR/AcrR family transcriptional regulator [Erysipelotrichaceae bacterium]